MRARRLALVLCLAGAVAAAVSPARAAEPDDPADASGGAFRPRETADAVLIQEDASWDRHLHDVLRLPRWIDLGVDHRTRFELLDDAFRPGEPQTQAQFPQRTRVRLGVDGPGPLRWLVELQDARTSNDGPRDFTGGEIDELDVLQLLVAATGRDLLGRDLRGDLHVGRLTLDLGSRRLLARNGTRNTTNAFDGVHLQLGARDLDWRVRGFYTWPVPREEGAFDDDPSTRRHFWGLAYEDTRLACAHFDLAYLGLDDDPGRRELHTLGARAFRPPERGRPDYELELIGQVGERRGRDHGALAAHAELGYTLALPWSPRLVAQFDYASGTEDPDGDSHTFDPLFGSRRFDLAPTGIYGPFRRANILSPGVRLVVRPTRCLEATVKLRYWELAERRDAFSGTGLRDATGAAGRRLGTDVELQLEWSPLPWLSFEASYDHWFKGSYLDRVAGVPSRGDPDHLYVATRVRF